MPNRILKETITTSCEINQLSAYEERFFYRLIVICDDFGRAEARTPILRAKCFPLKLDKVKEKDVEKWLSGLINAGLVELYSVNDKLYLQMVTWDKHQHRRAKTSKFPGPEQGMKSSASRCDHMRANSPEESRNRGIEESRNRKTNYAPAVNMYEEEYQKLVDKFGESEAKDRIERLSLYKKSKGKQYKCDYSTILAWARRDEKQKPEEPKRRSHMTREEQVARGLLSE